MKSKKEKIDIEEFYSTICNSTCLCDFLLKKIDDILRDAKSKEIDLVANHSKTDCLIEAAYYINQLGDTLDDLRALFNTVSVFKKSRYYNNLDLIVSVYKKEQSAYKCKEALNEQGIDISITHIYNILHKLELI